MSITGKVRFGLAVLLALLAALFVVSFVLDRNTRTAVDTAITKNFAAADQLAELGILGQSLRRYEKEFFIYADDPTGRAKYRKEWTETYDKIQSKLASFQQNQSKTFSTEDVLAFNTWKAAADFYGDEFKNIMKKADEGQLIPPAPPVETPAVATKAGAAAAPAAPVAAVQTAFLANGMIGPGKDRFRTLLDGTTKMRQAKASESAKSVEAIRTDFSRATWIQLGVFVVGFLIAAYLMFSIPKSVRAPIDAFVGNVEKMSKGDLKQAIDATGAKEFDTLASSLDRLRIAQAGLVDRLRARAA